MRRAVGKMRYPIALYEPARSSDGQSGFIRGDAKICDAWMELKPLNVVERLAHDKLEQAVSHKAAIRFDTRFIQGRYLTYNGRKFYIEGVTTVDELDRFMELKLREDGLI